MVYENPIILKRSLRSDNKEKIYDNKRPNAKITK